MIYMVSGEMHYIVNVANERDKLGYRERKKKAK